MANLLGAHHKAASLIERAADDVVACSLGHRHRFAGDHGLIDRTAALDEFAVHRNLFSWTDAQALADLHKIQHNFFVGSVSVNPSRHFWREIEERAYGAAGLFSARAVRELVQAEQGR